MSIIALILYLALIGFCVWLILQIPMPQPFKNIILGLVVVILILFALQQLGLVSGMNLRL